MATIIRLQDLDLSGLGLPTFDWADYEKELSTLPFLDTWIDPERIGAPIGGGVIDKMHGDTYAPQSTVPARTANANLGGKPAWDYTDVSGVGFRAVRRLPPLSWSAVFVVDLPADWAASQGNWLTWQGPAATPSKYQVVIQNNASGNLSAFPAFADSFGSNVSMPLTAGAHIVIASWDNEAKRVSLIVDSEDNYVSGTFPGISSAQADTTGRWTVGTTPVPPKLSLGNLLIFNRAVDNDPYTVGRLLTVLKQYHGL